jgi:hypothetical protein
MLSSTDWGTSDCARYRLSVCVLWWWSVCVCGCVLGGPHRGGDQRDETRNAPFSIFSGEKEAGAFTPSPEAAEEEDDDASPRRRANEAPRDPLLLLPLLLVAAARPRPRRVRRRTRCMLSSEVSPAAGENAARSSRILLVCLSVCVGRGGKEEKSGDGSIGCTAAGRRSSRHASAFDKQGQTTGHALRVCDSAA